MQKQSSSQELVNSYFSVKLPHWDPLTNNEHGAPTATASARIKRDLMQLFTEPPPGLYVVADEANMMVAHAIIFGVLDTPYEGGYFYFILKCPNDYPLRPPKIKLMTTDAGRVRFNPNMYQTGKICLSILGTWAGPAWSPALQLSGLLLSIQSLMNDKPFFNEPGFTEESIPGQAKAYSEMIQHETLRVAVCGMLENECNLSIPQHLQNIMERSFLQYYDQYIYIVKNNLHKNGQPMLDPYKVKVDDVKRFDYNSILRRLQAIKNRLSSKYESTNLPESIPPPISITSVDNC